MRNNIRKIISSRKTSPIYTALINSIEYKNPHTFIKNTFLKYKKECPNNPSVNGRIFELLICHSLNKEGILPFYYQASFERVPNVVFDIVLYNPNSPTVLTIKTSLRERYKQSDLEGVALKQVYRKAKIYLITLSVDEIKSTKRKIKDGSIMGRDDCFLANEKEFDSLLKKLKKEVFIKAEKVLPIQGVFVS